ncbi:helix-turn-helix domain-containing protein [Ramlibacter sp. PS4R-6]|uniref:helix-turn-helix domain-containing protein n=1 Tax=Ramlibacter sp. PS4R-6 TaxID=3133438 RepID=UPI0030A2A7E6
MPNIASLLKEEIARVSRKQSRTEIQALKKANSHYRGQIAELKRRMQALEQQVRRLGKAGPVRGARAAAAEDDGEEGGPQIRYSAKSLASQRKRLGLSAASLAKLLGVSALSVYKWESGNTRPRRKQIEAIAQLRGMGRRDAQKKLEELG